MKKQEKTVEEKIGQAKRKRTAKMTAIYLVGLLGGIGWAVTFYEGKNLVNELSEPLVVVNTVQAVEPAEAVEWNEAVFTSYSEGDGYTPGAVMASGKDVYVGAVACPRDMALGTVIEVKGHGTYTCEDRKSIKHPDSFDIYSETIAEAKQFGVKNLEWRVK